MLDDLKFIHSRDSKDALGVAEKQWQQLQHSFNVGLGSVDASKIINIVYAGMGGSAFPASYIQAWAEANVPLEIIRNYSLPKYVGQETLFFAASHSGNTEETISALSEAESKNAQIIIITSGGKLLEIAKEKNYPVFELPAGIQPRMSSLYFIRAITEVLVALGIADKSKIDELNEASDWLKEQPANWRPDVAVNKNPAKAMALEIAGKSAIIYSSSELFPAANKFKIGLNENAKNLAWANQYPEFNHNEFIGWTSHPIVKSFAVIEIRSALDNPRVQKRFEISEKLLSGRRPAPFVINPEGDSHLKQLLWTSMFGDFCSIYVALVNNVDPTPVELVERLKHDLG